MDRDMNQLSAKALADFLRDPESMRKAVARFDETVDGLFEPLRKNIWFNRLFYSASAMADHSILWFLLAAIKALRSQDQAKLAKRAAIALAAESIVVNLGVKSIFRRERPSYSGDRPLPLRQPLTSSFPSGHSSAAVCAYIFLSENDSLAPLYLLIALIVAPSRIHVKIHHASDVIGGLLFGWVFAKLFRGIFRN
ncbi:MAG: phosphatase PAP2 family protein [Actinomycetota bacterium]|jgi:undecaprenyl-diphosphatase|nr:phosphatase PAP2 family protein [Actinomycetota bacterium]